MNTIDNICANCTGTGGSIGILRISGPGALAIGRKVWHGKAELGEANERKMLLGKVGIDRAMAVFMKGPRSYTGDDVVELHCHGGAASARQALECVLRENCRLAEPGEFTFRAFANGKLDLLQAEAVADIVKAGSQHALAMAEKQLAGSVSGKLNGLYDFLSTLLAECESDLDFPEAEIKWESPAQDRFDQAYHTAESLLLQAQRGIVARDGVAITLAGRPNAGKSSLFNLLLGRDRSIVTAIPGTTRDTVEEGSLFANIPVRLTDTAGLRSSDDPVEKIGVERSQQSIRSAEAVFWVLDGAAADLDEELRPLLEHLQKSGNGKNTIAVWNKCDLVPGRKFPVLPVPAAEISVLKEENLESLETAFRRIVDWAGSRENLPEFALSQRCISLLEQSRCAIERASGCYRDGIAELAAEELHNAIECIGQMTGRTASPDVLDTIFSKFCIGK